MKVFKSYLLWIISCLLSVSGMARQVDIIHGPYLQNLKETEVTIVWLSNKPTVGWVVTILFSATTILSAVFQSIK